MKSLNPIRIFTASTIFIFSSLSASEKKSMSDYLPEDTLFVWEVDHWNELQEEFSQSPWGEVADFPAWAKIQKWIGENWAEGLKGFSKKERGEMEEYYEQVYIPLMESLNGGLAVAIGQIERSFENEVVNWENEDGGNARWQARRLPQVSLLAQSKLSEQEFKEMMKSVKEWIKNKETGKTRIEKSTIEGAEIHWIGHAKSQELNTIPEKDTMLAISFHEGMLLALSGGEEHVEETILRIQGKSKAPTLSKSVQYQYAFDEIEKGQARAFIDFKKLISFVEQIQNMPNFKFPENPLGITFNGFINGLGLKGLDHFAMQIDFEDHQFSVAQGLFMDEREGLLAFLKPVGSYVELYDFCPANAFGVSTFRLDFAEMWPTVEKTLARVSPGLGLLLNSQIQAFEDQAKLSFRKDLFGSLGDEGASFSYLNLSASGEVDLNNPSSALYAISLKDPELFDRTLRSLLNAVSPGSDLFQEREQQGVLVRSMRGLGGGTSLSYAIKDRWLLLSMGEERYLNQLINRMKGAKSSLWKQAHIQKALKEMPTDVRQLDYANFRKIMPLFSSLPFSVLSDADDFDDFPFFMLFASQDHEDGLISKGKLFRIPK
jgi:hypothetical protein